MRALVLCWLLLIGLNAHAETVLVAGSTTCLKIVRPASEAFARTHPDATFALAGGGSMAGIALVLDGRVHIGMISREPTREERALLQAQHVRIVPIAVDAIVPIVSREVYARGVRRITRGALADIYAGRLRNWQALGGPDRALLVADKNVYHGTHQLFMRYLGLSGSPAAPARIELDNDEDMLHLVGASDQAIGYLGIGYLDDSVRALPLVVNGAAVAATTENIRQGRYPLVRRLYLLIAPAAPTLARAFADFLRAPAGARLVRAAGFLPPAQ